MEGKVEPNQGLSGFPNMLIIIYVPFFISNYVFSFQTPQKRKKKGLFRKGKNKSPEVTPGIYIGH